MCGIVKHEFNWISNWITAARILQLQILSSPVQNLSRKLMNRFLAYELTIAEETFFYSYKFTLYVITALDLLRNGN